MADADEGGIVPDDEDDDAVAATIDADDGGVDGDAMVVFCWKHKHVNTRSL